MRDSKKRSQACHRGTARTEGKGAERSRADCALYSDGLAVKHISICLQ